MSQVGSEVGGKAAGSLDVNQEQFPSFTSPGGVTPQQTALADYDYGQNLLQGQAQFEGSDAGGGASLSSMASQVAGGANMGRAENLAKSSDTNQVADLGAFNNDINITQQNNESLLAEQQTDLQNAVTNVDNADSAAGLAAGHAKPTGTS